MPIGMACHDFPYQRVKINAVNRQSGQEHCQRKVFFYYGVVVMLKKIASLYNWR